MAYNGYLIRILQTNNNYDIPLEYINEKSYEGTMSTLDKGSSRDGLGVLHRNVILQVPHCSFTTRSLKNSEVGALFNNIQARYTSAKEKKVSASIYITETDSYYTGSFYIPDTPFKIHHIDHDNTIHYEPITIEFIGYGEA